MADLGARAAASEAPLASAQRRSGSSALNVTAAVLGNALEFYDFGVYGAYAVFIGRAFFPNESALASLLLSLATYGVGFIARPLGGMVIGAYADRHGRKPAMTLTIWLMAIGTGMIGVLPTYATIGAAAPILLVLARLIQGFSTGGEMGPATTYLVESAPRRRRSLFGSWQLASQNIGGVLAGLIGFVIAQLFVDANIQGGAWRIPFFLGLVIAPVGIYIRNRIDETLDLRQAHKSNRALLDELFGRHGRPLLLCFLLIPGATVTQYFLTYTVTFSIATLKLSTGVAFLAYLMIGISGTVFSLVGGWLGDRFGLKPVAIWPRLLLILLVYPVLLIVVREHTPLAVIGLMPVLMALQGMSGSVGIVLIPRCFPPAVRTAALSIAYATGVAIFGGSAQVIFTSLIAETGEPTAHVWWVILSNLITICALIAIQPLPDEAPQPTEER